MVLHTKRRATRDTKEIFHSFFHKGSTLFFLVLVFVVVDRPSYPSVALWRRYLSLPEARTRVFFAIGPTALRIETLPL